jgi:CRP/FNR family transcriptional regulator, cyclic AMP receptor protein
MAVPNPQTNSKFTRQIFEDASSPAEGDFMTAFLRRIPEGKHAKSFRTGETIFRQGSLADAIYFVQTGRVKVSVLSPAGKERVLAIRGPDTFFGERSLLGQSLRKSTAEALEPVTVFRVEKKAILRALLAQPDLSAMFSALLLKRNMDLEEDLCDQLFNHSEKRLARVLLKLARRRERESAPDARITRLSHETLAEMVGTTRSRITFFMNKFRKAGLIEYDGHVTDNGFELTVKTKQLTDLVMLDN